MKINYLALVAAILAIAGLALPWFTFTMTAPYDNINAAFTVYLYQIQGTINGVSATAFANVWFVFGGLALAAVTVVCCFAGAFLAGRKGQVLLLLAGIVALLSMVAFGGGLLMSDYIRTALEPGAVMAFFPNNALGITTDTAMNAFYNNIEWWLGYGFWVTIGTAILAFVAAVAPSLSKKAAAKSTEQ